MAGTIQELQGVVARGADLLAHFWLSSQALLKRVVVTGRVRIAQALHGMRGARCAMSLRIILLVHKADAASLTCGPTGWYV